MLLIVTLIMLAGAAVFIHSMFFGAPFLPSRREHVERALDLLALEPGQRLVELGSGDGRVLIAAAKRGIIATGYEINPLLFAWSWLRTLRFRSRARVKLGSYWPVSVSGADGIYVFLLQPYMKRLDHKLSAELHAGAKVVSFVYYIPDKQPTHNDNGLFLYKY